MKEVISLKIENEEINFAEFTNREKLELVIICKSKNIFLLNLKTKESDLLTTLDFPLEYSEDLFSYFESTGNKKELLSIQSFQNYICIVQKYGQNGIVLNLKNPNFRKELKRGDYCVEHCTFPIAFYENDNQTFLIHGTDWNRLDITNLETDKILTERIVDYETSSNYFDYFHSSLLMSPDAKHFTSNGWVWSPYDIITVYQTEKFIQEFEMSNTKINFEIVDGYNWDRPLCWVNNTTLGIGYNKKEDEEIKGIYPSEIIFVDILKNEMIKRIEFEGFAFSDYGAVEGELFFDSSSKHFIGLNKQSGLLITDSNGKEIYKDSNLTSHKYSQKHKLLYRMDYENQFMKITEIK
ncbi:MAG: hypothetical protein M3405_06815 [Acidobacteriota bacterium]|jgi:hypothetical protein|nr:hypothetical protein [Acidobacteriota bacterium]